MGFVDYEIIFKNEKKYFVNWWDNIKYDLKTIMASGWSPGLIPDDYMIEAFFQVERKELETLEITQSEKEAELATTIETAMGLLEYEADERETFNATLAKKELKIQVDYYTTEVQKPEYAQSYTETLDLIGSLEKTIKETKAAIKTKNEELQLKLILKRFGSEDEKTECNRLFISAVQQLSQYDVDIEGLISEFRSRLKDDSDYDKINKLQKLKTGLMHDLLTGRVRVKELLKKEKTGE